jgi:hypothetical protein
VKWEFGFWATLEVMLALAGQLFRFGSKPVDAKHQSRIDGATDFCDVFLAQVIGEQFSVD